MPSVECEPMNYCTVEQFPTHSAVVRLEHFRGAIFILVLLNGPFKKPDPILICMRDNLTLVVVRKLSPQFKEIRLAKKYNPLIQLISIRY